MDFVVDYFGVVDYLVVVVVGDFEVGVLNCGVYVGDVSGFDLVGDYVVGED